MEYISPLVEAPITASLQDNYFLNFDLVSCVRRILSSDTTKSIDDDNVSPRVLKSRASALCGPLTALSKNVTLLHFPILER